MTMPKTLAALPSSQYATVLDDVLGKLLDLLLLWAASLTTASFALTPSMVALLLNGCVDVHRTDCKTEGRGAACRGGARTGECRHRVQAKRRRESRGAAVRSCGRAWNIEAMVGGTSVSWAPGQNVHGQTLSGGSMA